MFLERLKLVTTQQALLTRSRSQVWSTYHCSRRLWAYL